MSASLLGLAELAEVLGVTKQVITNWKTRREGFPSPVVELKSGPVWSREKIEAWAKDEGIEVQISRTSASSKKKNGKQRYAVITAVMNMKGGVGKSTLSANLGWSGAYTQNLRLLLVDLDPQFNLSQYILGQEGYEELVNIEGPTVADLFKERVRSAPPAKDLVREVKQWDDGSCLHIIPASLELAWSMRYAVNKPHVLRDCLNELRSEYDLILIDCAPTESVLTTAAYLATDYIFIPVRPEFLSTIGLPLLLRSIEEFKGTYRNEDVPQVGGIIFNDASNKPEHNRSRQFVREIAEKNGWYVFENEISHSDSYPKGARYGRPIFMTEYARDDKKSELSQVTGELMGRVGL
jgi:chromosome partitioning protein